MKRSNLRILLLSLCCIAMSARSQTYTYDRHDLESVADIENDTEIESVAGVAICADSSSGDSTSADSVAVLPVLDGCVSGWSRFENSYLGRSLVAGVPLVGFGIIATSEDHHLRDWRNDYAGAFHTSVDGYLRFAPAVTLLGMKIGGVESATPWPQMLTADLAATAIMGGSVKFFKIMGKRDRPDGDGDDSFPSGHTAAAFMCATMLHHEYGARYPWLSAAGYATAAATAYMRMANNRHWLGDVLTGAGIGIISTELGYLVSDLIWHRPLLQGPGGCLDEAFDADYRPSFVGVYLTYDTPGADMDIDGVTVKTAPGCSLGLEGAWFFSRNIGVGGIMALSTRNVYAPDSESLQHDTTRGTSGMAGLYWNLPLSRRFSLGAKTLAGCTRYRSQDVEIAAGALTRLDARTVMQGCAGISANFRVQPALTYRVFCDVIAAGGRVSGTSAHLSIGAQAAFCF